MQDAFPVFPRLFSILSSVAIVLMGLFSPATQALTMDQTRYKMAVDAIRAQRPAEARALRQQLGHYPLALYIDYYDLLLQPDSSRLDEVLRFVGQDPQGLLAGRLKARYLRLLADEQKWPAYMQLANGEPRSLGLRCQYYLARWSTGEQEVAYQFANDIWMHSGSRPGECSALFMKWKDAGRMTPEKVWQRMLLVFPQRNSSSMLDYLNNELQGSLRQSNGQLLASLYAKPEQLLVLLPQQKGGDGAIMATLTLQRLASQEPLEARALYGRAKSAYGLNTEQTLAVEGSIARQFLLDKSGPERAWVDQALRRQHDPALIELRLRQAVWEADWHGVKSWVQRIPGSARSDVRWTYWLARAEEALGKKQHAQALYRQASYERSYYGFLAADRVGVRMPFNPAPLTPALTMSQASARWSAVARVRELLALQEHDQARSEWIFLMDSVSQADKLQLGSMALEAEWYDLAVLSSIRAKAWDALELRFPTPMNSVFSHFATLQGVDMSLLYALARQESALYHKAQSPVGASGLMQLMPTTAAHMAKKIGFPYMGQQQLIDPEVNIRLGSAYIKELLNNYGGNRVLAAAAYNAGPGRVRQWRRISAGKNMDVWVENIPYRETRNYVQNVLVFNAIYQRKLQHGARFLTEKERTMKY
jgi:soluble lytic murein transglycosylase